MDSKGHSSNYDEFSSLRTYFEDKITKNSKNVKYKIKNQINNN